jgi:AcrR family transcriptional regulator
MECSGGTAVTEVASKREQVREERRRQILEAALAVFTQKGFHTANVSDVAAEAGVSQGTIYWYFDSKDELFAAALLSFFEGFGQGTTAALAHCQTATDKLRALALSLVGFADEVGGLFMRVLEFWAASPDRHEPAAMWVDLLVQYKDVVVAIVKEGVQNGEFQPVDAESLVWAIMAAYDGLAAYALLMPTMDLARVSHVFAETLLGGLAAGPVAAS